MTRRTSSLTEVRHHALLSAWCRGIGELIEKQLPEDIRFTLLIYHIKSPFMSYAGNVDRAVAAQALREMADTLERGEEVPPGTGKEHLI
jgi:hypothetical protein